MTDPTEQGEIKLEINQGLATIEFYHPQSNSLPSKLLAQLADTITSCGDLEEVLVILLRSSGDRAFCAGASFDELGAIEDLNSGLKFFSGFANVINAMRKCPKLIVGRVHGKAVGGAVGLAAAVDYCFATSLAAIKLSELAVGIGPFVVGPAVERKMGLSAMSDLAINATEWRSAAWAAEKGLYYQVSDSTTEMDEAIDQLIQKLLKSNPEAMSELKRVFWEGTENWGALLRERAAISGRLVLSDFTKNAINSFKNNS